MRGRCLYGWGSAQVPPCCTPSPTKNDYSLSQLCWFSEKFILTYFLLIPHKDIASGSEYNKHSSLIIYPAHRTAEINMANVG